jgi:hypothetical protein
MQTRLTDNVLTKDPKVIACCPMSQPASSPTSVSIASPSPFPLTTKSDVLRDPKTNRGILVLLPCANCLFDVRPSGLNSPWWSPSRAGLVFTAAERSSLGINGLLPASVASAVRTLLVRVAFRAREHLCGNSVVLQTRRFLGATAPFGEIWPMFYSCVPF